MEVDTTNTKKYIKITNELRKLNKEIGEMWIKTKDKQYLKINNDLSHIISKYMKIEGR